VSQLAIIEAGPVLDASKSQWFTSPVLADRLVGLASSLLEDCARRALPLRVLEPSAGSGNLVRAVLRRVPTATIDAVEIDVRFIPELEGIGPNVTAIHADYLAHPAPAQRYDLAPCNLPFDDGAETPLLEKLLDEAERIPALLPSRSLFGRDRHERVWWRFDARNPKRDWWIRQIVNVVPRPRFAAGGGSDDIVLLDLRRVPGPCEVSW
jgi:hypothetical protein